ncbi:MAG TPA: peptidylprolyl isomerase [Sandaracinaceae bacterium LLY-WYZ-13_1]|nr:peptidylprolyl isomerase [Sandaracinaceae bacterium LLY-WYZ-13_1]
MSRLTASLLLGAALFACGADDDARPERPERSGQSPAEPPVARAAIIREADRRIVGDTIRRGLRHPDPALRRAAMRAVARQRDPALVPLLRRGLRDTDPGVRRAASLGLGAFEDEAPASSVPTLAGALAAETDAATRAAMIRDLGRLRTDAALRAVTPELRSAEAAEREAACLAVAERGLAERPVPATVRSRLGALVAPSEPTEVRLACAYALARLPAATAPDETRGALVALGLAADDADPEVRAYAYRALGRHGGADLETLRHGTRDEDWRVAAHAFRALGRRAPGHDGGAAILADALREAYDTAVEDGDVAGGPPLHVLLTALSAARPLARRTPIHDLSAELHASLGRVPEGTPRTRERGLAHCAAAELTDRGRGWPSRVEDCGLEQVLPEERAVLEAEVLGALDGAAPQRLARLRRLLARDSPAVRQAAVRAAAAIVHEDATTLVLDALATDDPGVRAAGLDALATIARRAPAPGVVPPPLPVDRVIRVLEAVRDATPDAELETLVTWIDALDATDARRLAEPLEALTLHPNHAVRTAARALAQRWQLEVPEGEVPEPSNPIDRDRIPDPDTRPRVRLETDRGDLVLELRPDAAPTTVARFLGLVRSRFYEDLPFHRVVPAFVVQGGDPRGDGYGGPGWSQRCEDNRLPYRRGTVGMALAGRDTGGSQFFVTHSAQPHLEGRYTAFGQVVEGLDVLDALQAGDTLRGATVTNESH